MSRRRIGVIVLSIVIVGGGAFYRFGESFWGPVVLRMTGQRTVGDVLNAVGADAEARLRPYVLAAGLPYPPGEAALIGLKAEKRLEVWVRGDPSGAWRHVRDYPILKASGKAGPKLREGDNQVPEGVYDIVALNPNSKFYLSMKVDYPNAFDLTHAAEEARTELGGDIFIHGKEASIGCLAMGDEAIEELFVLVATVGMDRTRVILAPQDLRADPDVNVDGLPAWSESLYRKTNEILGEFPLETKSAPRT